MCKVLAGESTVYGYGNNVQGGVPDKETINNYSMNYDERQLNVKMKDKDQFGDLVSRVDLMGDIKEWSYSNCSPDELKLIKRLLRHLGKRS